MAILTYNDCGEQRWFIGDKKNNGGKVNFKTLYNNHTETRMDINLGEKDTSIHLNKINGEALIYQEKNRTSVIYPNNTRVKYSRKRNCPFVCGSDRTIGDIIAVSINLKGRRLSSLYNNFGIIYAAGFIQGEALDFIATIPPEKEKAQISIVVQDDATGMVYSYRFVHHQGRQAIAVYTKELHKNEIPPKGERGYINLGDYVNTKPNYHINIYKPNRPTYTILTPSVNTGELTNILTEKFKITSLEQHNILGFEQETLENVAGKLIQEFYGAVTLFIETPMNLMSDDSQEAKNINYLMDNFETVYTLDKTGYITKVKY